MPLIRRLAEYFGLIKNKKDLLLNAIIPAIGQGYLKARLRVQK
jgi:hypothetical protein